MPAIRTPTSTRSQATPAQTQSPMLQRYLREEPQEAGTVDGRIMHRTLAVPVHGRIHRALERINMLGLS